MGDSETGKYFQLPWATTNSTTQWAAFQNWCEFLATDHPWESQKLFRVLLRVLSTEDATDLLKKLLVRIDGSHAQVILARIGVMNAYAAFYIRRHAEDSVGADDSSTAWLHDATEDLLKQVFDQRTESIKMQSRQYLEWRLDRPHPNIDLLEEISRNAQSQHNYHLQKECLRVEWLKSSLDTEQDPLSPSNSYYKALEQHQMKVMHDAVGFAQSLYNYKCVSGSGRSMLHQVASCGHTAVVRLLIEKWPGVSADDARAGLQLALENGYAEVVQLLREHGTDLQPSPSVPTLILAAEESGARMDRGEPVPRTKERGGVALPAHASAKHALVIGSSYDDVLGTENDVKTVVGILKRYGFQIQTLSGAEATRLGILDAWKQLISNISKDDSVVIYYSGYGGLAELEAPGLNTQVLDANVQEPTSIQFLVPSDYDASLKDWRGIMDSEISKLLLDTTEKTQNVTYILDCCHSASLIHKRPTHHAVLKALPKADYSRTLEHLKQLRKRRVLLENEYWANPHVVRIAAASDYEPAWKYQNAKGEYVGILTEKLALVIGDQDLQLSWRNIMTGVNALIEREFGNDQKPQQPRSAGADTRIPFSTKIDCSVALLAELQGEHITIQGGRVHGVSKGDSFTLIPLIPNQKVAAIATTASNVHAITEVKRVYGFSALASKVSEHNFPYSWALAHPHYRQHRWPVLFPKTLGYIEELLEKSSDLKYCEPSKEPLIEFRLDGKEDETVTLYSRGVQISSRESRANSDIEELFYMASIIAQAQDVLSFGNGSGEEEFRPDVQIKIGVVHGGKEELRAFYSTRQVLIAILTNIQYSLALT